MAAEEGLGTAVSVAVAVRVVFVAAGGADEGAVASDVEPDAEFEQPASAVQAISGAVMAATASGTFRFTLVTRRLRVTSER